MADDGNAVNSALRNFAGAHRQIFNRACYMRHVSRQRLTWRPNAVPDLVPVSLIRRRLSGLLGQPQCREVAEGLLVSVQAVLTRYDGLNRPLAVGAEVGHPRGPGYLAPFHERITFTFFDVTHWLRFCRAIGCGRRRVSARLGNMQRKTGSLRRKLPVCPRSSWRT